MALTAAIGDENVNPDALDALDDLAHQYQPARQNPEERRATIARLAAMG